MWSTRKQLCPWSALIVAVFSQGCGASQQEAYAANKQRAERQRAVCLRECDASYDAEKGRSIIAAGRHQRSCNNDCFDAAREQRESVANPNGELTEAYKARRDRERECRRGCEASWERACDSSDGSTDEAASDRCVDRASASSISCRKECSESPDPGPRPPPGPSPQTRHRSDVAKGECIDENLGWKVVISSNVISQRFTGFTQAHPEIRTWTIGFRPDVANYTTAVQRFMFAHECGHVNSGLGATAEITANCWAAKRLTQEDAMNGSEWQELYDVLVRAYPVPTGPYPAGESQVAMIKQCIAATPRSAE